MGWIRFEEGYHTLCTEGTDRGDDGSRFDLIHSFHTPQSLCLLDNALGKVG